MPEIDVPEGQGGRRYHVPALEKGFEILELLALTSGGLNLTAIATQLGRSTGELYRIIQYLEGRNYIERSAADTYSLTMRLFHLSHGHPPVRSLVSVAVPVMEDFAAATGQSCHLAVLGGTNVTIVAQIDSPLAIWCSVRLGAQFPAWELGSGILLCAMQGDGGRRALLQQLARTLDVRAMAQFEKEISQAAERGYDERQSARIPGIVDLSFPILDRNAHVVATLTTPYLPQREALAILDEVRCLVEDAAVRISKALGWKGPWTDAGHVAGVAAHAAEAAREHGCSL